MKSNHTLAVALATLSLVSSCVLQNALGEESSAWREAKKAFAPLNVLRIGSSEKEKEAETGTTVRVFGIDRGEDLTVFPPVKAPPRDESSSQATVESTTISPSAEPEVVGVKIASGDSEAESSTVVHSQRFDQQDELIALPVVEPSMTTQLASSQANQRVAFATQAYMAEESAEQGAIAPTEEYVQGDGTVEWGSPVMGYGAGCCDTGCCDGCCGCQPCCPPKIMVVGVEAVFLSPDINGTPVNYLYEDGSPPTDIAQFGPAFGNAALDDLYGAPRISLGCQGCKWGIVGRYFHLRAGEHDHLAYDPLATIPPTSHSYDVNSILEAYYTDIELTRNFCLHGCKNQFTFGVRYALLEHHESLYARSDTQDGLLSAYARRNRQAHGTGLTFGLNGRKPLFPCSCVHWFYNARGSVLWGCSHNEVESEANVVTTVGGAVVAAAGSINGASASVNEDLFIGEIQAGLQWDFALRCLPAKAFFRTAFEYQYWDASLGGAGSASFAGVSGVGDYQVTAGSFAPGLIVDFVGFSIGSGFTW